MRNNLLLLLCIFFTKTLIFAQHSSSTAKIEYIKNKGQWNENVLYKANIGGGIAWLENNQITFSFLDQKDVEKAHEARHSKKPTPQAGIKGYSYRMKFISCNENHNSIEKEKADAVHNYFIGADQSKWAGNIPLFGKIKYDNLFNGISAELYSEEGHFKYDYIITPHADVKLIKWKYDGVAPYLKDGNLIVSTPVGDVVEQKPYAYQIINGKKKKINCKYFLKDDIYSFEFPEGYDENYELIIDPTLIFSTYSGSTADNWGFTATYDDSGNMYAGGIVFASGYPTTTGAFDLSFNNGDTDAAITKFNPTGTALIYSTYIGGSSADSPHSLIVDASGNLIVMGTTGSSNFPVTTGCYDNSFNSGTNVTVNSGSYQYGSGSDIFVAKFNAAGSALIGSTFVGGTGNDGLNLNATLMHNYSDEIRGEVVLGSNGDIYVASSTLSTNFPTTAGALATAAPAGQNGCAFKLNANLTSLLWSTYIGGGSADAGYALKASPNGNVYVTGGTLSNNFPITAGTIKTTFGGVADGFLISLSDANGSMVASTYLGTTSYDQSFLIEIDNKNDIYVTGQTKGVYPISAGVYNNNGSSQFIHKLNPSLTATVFSTVFGTGSHSAVNISPTAFLVDNCRNIYVSGWGGNRNNEGSTTGLPITANAYDNNTDGSDFYFIVLEQNAQSLLYGTFFGSPSIDDHVDGGTSRFDKNGTIYQAVCAGCGGGNSFPTTAGAWSNTNPSSNCNLGAIKMEMDYNGIDANPTASPNIFACNPPFNVNFQGAPDAVYHQWHYGDGSPIGTTQNPVHTYTGIGNFPVMYVAIDSATCNIADTVYLNIQATQSEIFSATFNIPPYDPCNTANQTISVEFTGSGADSLHWDMGNGTTFTNDTIINYSYSTPGTYIVSLTAYDLVCGDIQTFRDTVSFSNADVNATANASPNILACDPPYDVTFTGGSTPDHYWDFGDGSPAAIVANPSHTYTGLGNFTVMYVAIDSSTCNIADTAYLSVQIQQSETFSSTFNIPPYDPCNPGGYNINLEFTGSGADSLHWDMGNGTTFTNDTIINYTFPAPGTYIVTLTAYDFTCNQVQTFTDTVNFDNTFVNATANASPNVFACDPPYDVTFSGGTTPNHFWDFGDGSPVDTVRNPLHTYNTIGNFTVMYVAVDSATCNIADTAYLSVQIQQSETFSSTFNIPPYDPCNPGGYNINLEFTGSGADSLHWDMGNGVTFTNDTVINYSYPTPGNYIVSLTAYDFACNQTQTFTDTVRFSNTFVNATANAAPNIFACDPPYDVNFTGGTTPDHYWNFGDGSAADTAQNPLHTYTGVGNFTVMYVAIDSSTCNITDTAYLSVQIQQSETFSATFNIPPYDPCTSGSYTIGLEFTGSGADSLHWDMGNGITFTNDTIINYTYPTTGIYIISLTAYDFACNQVQTFTDTVRFSTTVVNATANATPNIFACDPPYDVNFTGGTTPDHCWNFGDGAPADTASNPMHTYTGIGNFTVMYIAIDSSTCNISDTAYLSVQILQSETFSATLDVASYDPCVSGNFAVSLEFTGSGADSLHWNMGNGTTFNNDTIVNYTYPAEGSYTITLIAFDYTCNKVDTITQTIMFNSNIVNAVANAAPNIIACDPPFTVTFSGGTTPDHLWTFGDGSAASSLASPSHVYTGTGNYTVTYIAIDSSSCNITDTAYLSVQILQKEIFTAEFTTVPPQPCSDSVLVDINFTGTGADALYWDMGNGQTFTNDTSIHYYYTEPGSYVLTLTAFDSTCNQTGTISQTIIVDRSALNGTITIPNVFSPNSDDKNEEFKVFYTDYPSAPAGNYFEEYNMQIFNRWGIKIFESDINGWDGTINGIPADEGVYFYIISYKQYCIDAEKNIRKGHLTILR